MCGFLCINPFWEVGGARLFSQKNNLKYPDPPPLIKNVPSLTELPPQRVLKLTFRALARNFCGVAYGAVSVGEHNRVI